ncbi:MAG: Stk1 family PASTA domain-containing Ser/Thr kinase [Desulfitobacteriaceae bacterium]|nr:Stk1 family PASTA domain-containing Ser/Thr kinase [Desulfitobacteriaceae bacterium]
MSKIFGGRYEVINKIGAGGMAIVYKAKDLLLNRVVTIKVLRDQFVSDDDFIRRFRREAQSAASLSHPNIVSIYDVGKDGDMEYIVMEYVEGHNLKEIIRDYAPLSTEQTLHLAGQLGEALRHAHEHHIIHRDIKPQNILITEDGRAKVTDFGIARAVSSATVTHTGDIVGSVHYLSPEQAKGIVSNEQSDIYSLGIIIYELLTGKVPYDGETPIAIALKHLQEQPLQPSKLNPKIESELETVIMKAISKSPDTRYASVGELLDDLEKVRSGVKVDRIVNQDFNNNDATQVHKSLVQEVNLAASSQGSNPSSGGSKISSKGKRWLIAAGIVCLLLVLGGFWFYNYVTVEETSVPDLTGLKPDVAEILLKDKKLILDPEISYEFSDNIAKDQIMRQYPDPNTKVKIGNSVTVVVSKGEEVLVFPDLKTAKMTEANALSMLETLGFTGKYTKQEVYSSTVPKGAVIDQDPLPQVSWYKSGPFTLTISKGPEFINVKMPNVIGKESTEAKALLEQNKFVVAIENESSDDYPEDVVIRTDPLPDASVRQGAAVKIYVSQGPGPFAIKINKRDLMELIKDSVPKDKKPHDVSVKILDYRGSTEVWHESYVGGDDPDVEDISCYSSSTLQITVDGTVKFEKKVSLFTRFTR